MNNELIIGIVGSCFCLIALGLTVFKKQFGDSQHYKLLNIIGGSLLLYYAILISSPPFIILEIAWISVPLIGLFNKNK